MENLVTIVEVGVLSEPTVHREGILEAPHMG